MSIRLITASVLALGLLAPVGAMAETNYNCSQDQLNKGDYTDCGVEKNDTSVQYGFAARDIDRDNVGPTGDFIDETAVESNQRSSTR